MLATLYIIRALWSILRYELSCKLTIYIMEEMTQLPRAH